MTDVRIKRDQPAEHVIRLTLARPKKLNAFDQPMLDQLAEALSTLEQDKATRTVILAAEGGKAFCAGADIETWSRLDPLDMWRDWIASGNRLFDRLARLRQPVIAAIDGVAYGGGLELALCADMRIATEQSRFALPETGIGTIPGWSGVRRLVKLIGLARAKSMVLTGAPVGAEQALASGLVSAVVEEKDLESETLSLARTIASRGPIATQLAKAMLDQAAGDEPGHAIQGFASAVTAFSEDG
ncbi:MAG: enoyl-CoA hydratase/isomerase family protein, partial [Alphaproteobacteria bacterium]|nr:enoyl-CoA hydratase/isomerase family protein [Alphaproteobacteria bacterium]